MRSPDGAYRLLIGGAFSSSGFSLNIGGLAPEPPIILALQANINLKIKINITPPGPTN